MSYCTSSDGGCFKHLHQLNRLALLRTGCLRLCLRPQALPAPSYTCRHDRAEIWLSSTVIVLKHTVHTYVIEHTPADTHDAPTEPV